ncbi:zinc finger, CCHC-type containing protein [Tanacetum coccineum]|uniref:Zinc finger, CCHC-type containing protein n=1 Tax=Tanacetum coccineum TaxID=301880 RepID=A0ABQ4ZB14_9ASTR
MLVLTTETNTPVLHRGGDGHGGDDGGAAVGCDGDGDGGSGVMMVVELWWAAMGRQPEERAARGGEVRPNDVSVGGSCGNLVQLKDPFIPVSKDGVDVAMKHMASNFAKLEKFKGVDFRRWQKKIHFLLSNMSVVYVLTTPMPNDGGENPTVEQNVKTQKNLWDNLGTAKNLAEDASSKMFLVSNFTNYKMTDSRPVMEQYNELLGILGRFTQHKMNMDESIQDSCIIDKLSPSWKDFKHREKTKECKANNVGIIANGQTWKGSEDRSCQPSERETMHVCKDRCWFKTYESLNDGSILHIGNESTALVHGRGYVDLSYPSNHMFRLNIVSDNIGSAFMLTSKLNDLILWHARLVHVHFKRMQDMSKDGLIPAFDMDTEKFQTCMLNKITKKPFQNVKRETKVLELIHSNLCDLHATPSLRNKKYFVTFIDDASREVVRLPNLKLKTLGERGIECIFVGYAEHSKVFRFYVIEPNDSVAINSIIESRDAIFDEHRVTDKIVQQSEPELRKSKRHMSPKDLGPELPLLHY